MNRKCYNAKHMKTAVHVMALAAAAVCGELTVAADARLVVRDDFRVQAAWKLPQFMGRDFWPLLVWYGWAAPGVNAPDGFEVYRECAIQAAGYTGGRKTPFEGPYSLADFYRGGGYEKSFAAICTTNYNHRPVVLSLRGSRPVWPLKAEYPEADREGFAKWKAEHPNYLGHTALGELDSDGFHYPKNFRGRIAKSEAELARQMQEAYPATYEDYAGDVYFKDRWIYEAAKRTSAYCFGDPGFWGEPSWYPGLTPLFVDAGANGAGYEASGAQMSPAWSVAMAYTRGAARLFGKPIWWYTANCYSGYTRAGKQQGGENRLTGNAAAKNAHGMKDGWWGPDNGLSPSLVARQNLYGYLGGAMLVEVENHQHSHVEDLPDGRKVPSVHARHFNDLYRLSRRLDRGVPYTPLALLFPVHERITADCNPEMERYMGLSISAAAFALVPAVDRRKSGIEGCFYNSEFGEMFDIVTPDLRGTDDTLAALRGYKAAVMFGNYRRRSPRFAAEGFVRGGGTLFLSCDQVRAGLVTEEMAGARFPGTAVRTADGTLVDERGRTTALGDPYVIELAEPGTAKALWRDGAGTPVAWANDFGKGRVVTVAVAGMMPYGMELPRNLESERDALAQMRRMKDGEVRLGLIRAVYRRIQEEAMPVRLGGDAIQWGVNRTAKGWLLWLFNNEGVTHFLGEPQELDPSKMANVSVFFNGFAPKAVSDAETGAAVPFGESAAVEVAPGGWRLVSIELK